MRVVLASSSPRRKELMNMLGIPYDIVSFDHDEVLNKEKSVYEQFCGPSTITVKSWWNTPLQKEWKRKY